MNSQQQVEEVNTEHLKVKVVRQPGCIIRLEMEVDPRATKAAYSKAVKEVGKEVSIPGFRKGRAPEAIVIQNFDKHVKREWYNFLLNISFDEFIKQTHLYPISNDEQSVSRAEVKSASKADGSKLLIEYQAKPQIPEVDLAGIELTTTPKRAITQKEIEEEIYHSQLHHAEWEEVADRGIQEGDFVDLTIDAIDEHPPRSICEKMRFEVKRERMGAWMINLLLGKHIHDVVEGMSEKDEAASQELLHQNPEEQEFKPTLCRIKINNIFTATIPALDESFAKKLGTSSIEELQKRVEASLNREAEEEVKNHLRFQVEKILLEKYPFDIPLSVIKAQRDHMVAKQVEEFTKDVNDPERKKEIVKEIETSVQEELDKAYRLYFISQKIAHEQHIEVREYEIMQEMMRQITTPNTMPLINPSMSKEDIRTRLYVNILTTKVLDHFASKAVIKQ